VGTLPVEKPRVGKRSRKEKRSPFERNGFNRFPQTRRPAEKRLFTRASFLSRFFRRGKSRDRQGESNITIGSEKRISGDNWVDCTDRKYFEKLGEYAVQKDEQAFKRALAAGILTGTCTWLKNGEIVYITDTAIFSGLVKVRRKGELQEFWTNIEAVK